MPTTSEPTAVSTKPSEAFLALPEGLLPELVQTLALLDGIPERIAELTTATLPFGSRSTLLAYGIVEDRRETSGLPPEISITPYGWEVIRACAHEVPRTQAQRKTSEVALDEARQKYERSKTRRRRSRSRRSASAL
jgi:hypothetical protein